MKRRKPPVNQPPNSGDDNGNRGLPETAIRRQTIVAALQHPAVMLPLCLCLLSTGYLVLLSPMFGGTLPAAVLAGAAGTAATASFLHRYTQEYARQAQEMLARLKEAQAQQESDELRQWHRRLQNGFNATGCAEGSTTLAGLTDEYEQLQTALQSSRETDPLAVSLMPALAAEIYRRGLSVLADNIELLKILHPTKPQAELEEPPLLEWASDRTNRAPLPPRANLAGEITALCQEIESLNNEPGQDERRQLKEVILADRRQRLQALDRLQLAADQLLYQAQRCEGSLQSTRIELAAVRAGSNQSRVDSVIRTLQETVKQVKEVQDELKRLGY